MKTDYYCKKCNLQFSEAKLPNMNKLHYCGELVRVTEFFDDGRAEVAEESSHDHH